jgi:hypothetical protein
MLYPNFFQNKQQKIQKTQKRQNERFLKAFETVKPDEEDKIGQKLKFYGVRKKKSSVPREQSITGEKVSSPKWRSAAWTGLVGLGFPF